jgi:hypothetical protein
MALPTNLDPNARTRCPRCKALTLAADWRAHDAFHAELDAKLQELTDALSEPAPEPELVDWPAADPLEDLKVQPPAGPYAPDVVGGTQL